MHFYDFVSYCGMLTDEKRLDAYVNALRESITPETVVLDLGAGTGVFSVLACEFGARKVYAVEVNPLIRLLEETIRERDLGDRIEIIQKLSSEVDLPERADLLVSDIHGGFPLFESSIETLIDARQRLLTEDAVMIPESETVYFAVSEAEEIYEDQVAQYLRDFRGFRLPAADRLVKNRWFSARSEKERLLTEPGVFAEIDYKNVTNTSFSAELEMEFTADGTAHGLRGWFENVLCCGSGVGNRIEAGDTTYASPFFPFEDPVKVEMGDRAYSKILANFTEGDYVWSWQTRIKGRGGDGQLKADFRQTVMASMIPDSHGSQRRTEYFTPKLNEDGEINSFVLSAIDGERLSGDIADQLLERFPNRFDTFEDAMEQVFAVTNLYSE